MLVSILNFGKYTYFNLYRVRTRKILNIKIVNKIDLFLKTDAACFFSQ